MTIGQVLLEQRQLTTQFPTIDTYSGLGNKLSKNKDMIQAIDRSVWID